MDNVVRGLSAASKLAGCAVRTLRELIAAGTLPASKDADGVWLFEVGDLDAIRAQLGAGAAQPVATAVAAAITYSDEPVEPEADADPRPSAPVPAWLLAAAEERPNSAPEPARATGTPAPLGAGGERPFWEVQLGAAVPSRAEIEALQAEVQALRAQLAQRDQQAEHKDRQIAMQQQQLVHARPAQIGYVAQAVAIEALTGAVEARVMPEQVLATTCALRDASTHALARLTPEQLASPMAWAVARQAAHVVSLQITAQIEAERAEREMPRRRGRARNGYDRGN